MAYPIKLVGSGGQQLRRELDAVAGGVKKIGSAAASVRTVAAGGRILPGSGPGGALARLAAPGAGYAYRERNFVSQRSTSFSAGGGPGIGAGVRAGRAFGGALGSVAGRIGGAVGALGPLGAGIAVVALAFNGLAAASDRATAAVTAEFTARQGLTRSIEAATKEANAGANSAVSGKADALRILSGLGGDAGVAEGQRLEGLYGPGALEGLAALRKAGVGTSGTRVAERIASTGLLSFGDAATALSSNRGIAGMPDVNAAAARLLKKEGFRNVTAEGIASGAYGQGQFASDLARLGRGQGGVTNAGINRFRDADTLDVLREQIQAIAEPERVARAEAAKVQRENTQALVEATKAQFALVAGVRMLGSVLGMTDQAEAQKLWAQQRLEARLGAAP